MKSQVQVYKVSRGATLLFESISKDAAVDFARHYYSNRDVICDIHEFLVVPRDHTVPNNG